MHKLPLTFHQVYKCFLFYLFNDWIIKKIDYMHIDVQGAEYKVVVGLGDLRPTYIFAETCEFETYDTGVTLSDFDELMKEKGYKIIQRHDYDTLYVYDGKPIA